MAQFQGVDSRKRGIKPLKARPEMSFGETESANVRIPLRYNNPFPESGELVVPLCELETEFCYPYPGKLISPFGRRGRSNHTGIDIKAIPNDTIRPRCRASCGCRNRTADTATSS